MRKLLLRLIIYTSTRNFEGLTVLKTPILELIIELFFQVLRKGSGVGVGNW